MKSNKDRSEDQTVLGVSMPIELKNRIKAIAHGDHRGMAPWCVIQLETAVAAVEAEISAKASPPIEMPSTLKSVDGEANAKKGKPA